MIKLRKADVNDAPQIMELVKTVLSGYGLETDPQSTDKDLSDLDQHYFKNNGWFAVMEHDHEIVGSYGIYKMDEHTCELRKMYLKSSFQGRGLGKQMMEDALRQAKELGYRRMVLETNRLLDRALLIYMKYGFVEYAPAHLSKRCDLAMKMDL